MPEVGICCRSVCLERLLLLLMSLRHRHEAGEGDASLEGRSLKISEKRRFLKQTSSLLSPGGSLGSYWSCLPGGCAPEPLVPWGRERAGKLLLARGGELRTGSPEAVRAGGAHASAANCTAKLSAPQGKGGCFCVEGLLRGGQSDGDTACAQARLGVPVLPAVPLGWARAGTRATCLVPGHPLCGDSRNWATRCPVASVRGP